MRPEDIGAITVAVLVVVAVFGLRALGRLLWRDRIFDGVIPGTVPTMLPGGPEPPTSRVKGGQEYNGEIAVAFSPPKGVTPGLVGTVVDGSADPRDLTATIVSLASRGWLTIAPLGADGRPLEPDQKAKDWLLTMSRRPPKDAMDDFEADLYDAIFQGGGRPEVEMSQLARSRDNRLNQARASLYRQVVRYGWYHRAPNSANGALIRFLSIAGALGVFVILAAIRTPIGLVSGLIGGGALLLLPRWLKPRVPRTALGTAVRIESLGFKKYLATAEADQFSFEEAAGIFSRYLPYAIVFGVADHWAKVFSELATKAELAGYGNLGFTFDWFDVWMISNVVSDFGSIGELGGLVDFADMANNADFAMTDVLGNIGDVTSGIGDFISNIDIGDFGGFGGGD